MPFPFDFEDSISLTLEPNENTIRKLNGSIIDSLNRAIADKVEGDSNIISFSGGILRPVTNWNILSSVSHGIIAIEKDDGAIHLRYYIKFTKMTIAATIAILVFFGPEIWQISSINVVTKVAGICLLWYCIVGGNYYITTSRFPSFIKKMADI